MGILGKASHNAGYFVPEGEDPHEGKHEDQGEHRVSHRADGDCAAAAVDGLVDVGINIAGEIRDFTEKRGRLAVLEIRHGG